MAYCAVFIAIAISVRMDWELVLIGHVGSALVALVLLYTPVIAAHRRGEDLGDYGVHLRPLGRGLMWGLALPCLVIFPLFALGYLGFFTSVCTYGPAWLAPPGACTYFRGWTGMGPPAFDLDFAEFAAVQFLVVALPEELFFRGYLLRLCERAIPPKRRLWGGGIGWALLLSSLAFALVHLPRELDPRALATFFPGLVFGWMRSATGSILAPVLAHGASNVFIRILDQMVFR